MDEANVTFLPAKWVRGIGSSDLTLYNVNSGRELVLSGIDAVVLVTGRTPVDGLSAGLEGKVAQLFVIGDALGVRSMAAATYEGQKFARMIGEPEAPNSVAQAYFAANDPAVYPAPAG